MRKGLCPVCGNNEVIEAIMRDLGDESAEYQAVTYEAVNFGELVPVYQRVAHGMLKLYVCRRCGYSQYYADSPHTIPIGDEFMTRLIKGS